MKPDVIFITESWANKYIASAELSLNCYTMYRRDRNLDDNGEVIRGGGVLMYITNNLKHYEIDHDVNNTESLWCTIQTAHGNSVKLGVCYDSTSNTKEDSDRLYNIMRTECQLNTIVCGDFNRPGINWDDMTSDKHGESYWNVQWICF